jgi:hypothetical protein
VKARSRATRGPRTVEAVGDAALQRLERLIRSEALRIASDLAAVGVDDHRVPQVIAQCLRAVADGLDGKDASS